MVSLTVQTSGIPGVDSFGDLPFHPPFFPSLLILRTCQSWNCLPLVELFSLPPYAPKMDHSACTGVVGWIPPNALENMIWLTVLTTRCMWYDVFLPRLPWVSPSLTIEEHQRCFRLSS